MRNILQFTFGGILLRLISKVFLSAIFLFFSFVSNAQERVVTGKVTDKTDNAPIAGATVRIKGTERGTTANADGTFKISVTDNAILQFSFIGFTAQEIQVGSKSTVNVVLNENVQELQEVVTTALGISKERRSLTNAIQTVKGSDLIKAREPNPINSLAGKEIGRASCRERV